MRIGDELRNRTANCTLFLHCGPSAVSCAHLVELLRVLSECSHLGRLLCANNAGAHSYNSVRPLGKHSWRLELQALHQRHLCRSFHPASLLGPRSRADWHSHCHEHRGWLALERSNLRCQFWTRLCHLWLHTLVVSASWRLVAIAHI